jgi:hypothetical protein
MRIAVHTIAVAAAAIGLFGPALAADLTGTEITALISGKTLYIETTATSAAGQAGQGVIYRAEDGTVLYRTPGGAIWHGKSEIKGNTNCIDWKERPGTGCTRYDKTGDVITIIDVTTGQIRAKIVRTAAGNAEKLAP